MTPSHVDVAAYAIGALDLDEVTGFEAHLRSCRVCPAELSWLRRVAYLLAAAEPTCLVEEVR